MGCISGHRSCSTNTPVVLNPGCSAVSRFPSSLIPGSEGLEAAPRPAVTFHLPGEIATVYKPGATLKPIIAPDSRHIATKLIPRSPETTAGANILFEKRNRPQRVARQDTCDQYCGFEPFKREVVPPEFVPHSRLYISDGEALGDIEAYVSRGLRVDVTVSDEERVRIVEAILNNAEPIGSLRDLMKRGAW